MIDHAAELCVDVFGLVYLAAWRSLPVFVVVAMVATVLRNRVPARYLCWLWLIVIVRLLLPFSVESDVSISCVADESAIALFFGSDEPESESADCEFDIFTYEDDNGESVSVALLPPGATPEEQAAADAIVAEMLKEEAAAEAALAANSDLDSVENSDSFIDTIEPVLILVTWSLPAVALLMVLRGVISHLRFARRLWKLPSITDQAMVDRLLRICDDFRVGRRPQVKEVPALHAPAVFGLLRPVICLPERWRTELTGEQLDWVFRHEVAHVKGRDGLLLSIAALAKSCHWFNPLSWVAVAKLKQNMERAADELATRHLNEMQVRQYGELLVQFATHQPSKRLRPIIGLLAMAVPVGLRQRIESLQAPVRRRRGLRAFIAGLSIVCIGVCGLTDATSVMDPVVAANPVPNLDIAVAEWERDRIGHISTKPGESNPFHSGDAAPKQTVAIDVRDAMAKAIELQPGIDAERFIVHYFLPYASHSLKRGPNRIVDGVLTVELTQQQEIFARQRLSAFEDSGLWQIVVELKMIETDIRLLDQFEWSKPDSVTRVVRLDRVPDLDDPKRWDEAHRTFDKLNSLVNQTEQNSTGQPASVPVRTATINRFQCERLIHQVQKDTRSNILQAPKVTFFNGQYGVISDVAQRPFVTDVSETIGEYATAYQPKISVFEEGSKFGVKAIVVDNDQTKLQMIMTQASVDDVKLASMPNRRGATHDERMTIQIPVVHSESIAVESSLKESEALLVFLPKPYASDSDSPDAGTHRHQCRVFMVRTQLISDPDALKAFVPNVEDVNRDES
ncbi:MAG: M56 family metallopeptidase [Planctomycetota bacterium]